MSILTNPMEDDMTTKSLRGFNVQVNSGHISDTFFNFRLENYDKLYQGIGKTRALPTEKAITEAITLDAKEFAVCMGIADPNFIPAIVDDFMGRV